MNKKEKLSLLIDELEDIRCDNFDINTIENRTLKEAVRIIRIIKETKYNICESCRKFDSSDRYCRLLQINHLPEEFGCTMWEGDGNE